MRDDGYEIKREGVNAPRPRTPLVEGLNDRWLGAVVRCRQFWRSTHNDAKTVGAMENIGFTNAEAVMVFKFAKDRGLLK